MKNRENEIKTGICMGPDFKKMPVTGRKKIMCTFYMLERSSLTQSLTRLKAASAEGVSSPYTVRKTAKMGPKWPKSDQSRNHRSTGGIQPCRPGRFE